LNLRLTGTAVPRGRLESVEQKKKVDTAYMG